MECWFCLHSTCTNGAKVNTWMALKIAMYQLSAMWVAIASVGSILCISLISNFMVPQFTGDRQSRLAGEIRNKVCSRLHVTLWQYAAGINVWKFPISLDTNWPRLRSWKFGSNLWKSKSQGILKNDCWQWWLKSQTSATPNSSKQSDKVRPTHCWKYVNELHQAAFDVLSLSSNRLTQIELTKAQLDKMQILMKEHLPKMLITIMMKQSQSQKQWCCQ